ncbi:hypothetical protein [Rhodoferax sediminis]|uniref:Uncharacterized protein n=1 Tax=Rhodoferax sediminis TaxID=2509614 RepID=A0A515DE20_9BURK|nr:hypothetical protein [Rhodoferax sediminis]QDL38645.1 hypothetical protein EUB48_16135 [Rhodoferax sediminis]
MTLPPRTKLLSSISSAPRPMAPRQMSMAFESAVIQDLTASERTSVVAQLASLLLQAAAGRPTGDDDGEL